MNEYTGLLRVLAPDLYYLFLLTFVIVIVAALIRRAIKADSTPQGEGVKEKYRRNTSRVAFWIWIAFVGAFLAHAGATTISLRVPRSDVNPTGVYQQMDDALTRR